MTLGFIAYLIGLYFRKNTKYIKNSIKASAITSLDTIVIRFYFFRNPLYLTVKVYFSDTRRNVVVQRSFYTYSLTTGIDLLRE